MSFDIQVDSRHHAKLCARDVLAEIERKRIESIALALADAEQAAAERLDELRTIRRAHDLLVAERNELRAEVEALRGLDVERASAERAWLAERDGLRKQVADALRVAAGAKISLASARPASRKAKVAQ